MVAPEVAGALANKLRLAWEMGFRHEGLDSEGNSIFTAMKNMLPMLNPDEIMCGGWDINSMNLGDAMK